MFLKFILAVVFIIILIFNVGATNKTFYGTDNRFGGVNAQQIVETANRGDGDIDNLISQLSSRKVAPTKSELLRAILDDNQKTYS